MYLHINKKLVSTYTNLDFQTKLTCHFVSVKSGYSHFFATMLSSIYGFSKELGKLKTMKNNSQTLPQCCNLCINDFF